MSETAAPWRIRAVALVIGAGLALAVYYAAVDYIGRRWAAGLGGGVGAAVQPFIVGWWQRRGR